MDEEMDGRTDEQRVRIRIRQKFRNNDMMMLLCEKFHQDRTLALLRTTMTKNLNMSGTDEPTDHRTICPSYFVCRGIKLTQ